MTSSSPVKAYNATMGTSVESGRLLISAFMYCLESEWVPALAKENLKLHCRRSWNIETILKTDLRNLCPPDAAGRAKLPKPDCR